MPANLQDLYRRLTNVSAEFALSRKQNASRANAAVTAISKLSAEQIELIAEKFPAIREVVDYTVDDLLANNNGEREKIKRLYNELTFEVDARLKYYEDALC